jgi:hypothetical protein
MDVVPLLCGAFQKKEILEFYLVVITQLNMHIFNSWCVEVSHLFNPLLLAGVIEGENVWDIGRSWHSQKCLDFHYFVSRQYCMRNASSIKSFTKRLVLRWCEAYSLEMIKTINKKKCYGYQWKSFTSSSYTSLNKRFIVRLGVRFLKSKLNSYLVHEFRGK